MLMNPQQVAAAWRAEWDLSLCCDTLSGCTQYPRIFAFKNISDWRPKVLIPVHFFRTVSCLNILHLS